MNLTLTVTAVCRFVKPTTRSLNTAVRVPPSTIVMDLRDVGVSDVLVSKIMCCVIADVTTV